MARSSASRRTARASLAVAATTHTTKQSSKERAGKRSAGGGRGAGAPGDATALLEGGESLELGELAQGEAVDGVSAPRAG